MMAFSVTFLQSSQLGEVVQELSYNLRNQPVIQKDTFVFL